MTACKIPIQQLATIARACGDASKYATAIMYNSPSSATLEDWVINNLREAAAAAGYRLTPIETQAQEATE